MLHELRRRVANNQKLASGNIQGLRKPEFGIVLWASPVASLARRVEVEHPFRSRTKRIDDGYIDSAGGQIRNGSFGHSFYGQNGAHVPLGRQAGLGGGTLHRGQYDYLTALG